MAIVPSNWRGWLTIGCAACGAAALVLAWAPAAWPNPLAGGGARGPVAGDVAVARLADATAAVDAACADGDGGAFAAATTATWRRELGQHLDVVGGSLDAATLREMARSCPPGAWLRQPLLAGFVAGARAAVAVRRPDGDGAQLLQFVWNGRRFLFDGARQLPAVGDAETARAAVVAAVDASERAR